MYKKSMILVFMMFCLCDCRTGSGLRVSGANKIQDKSLKHNADKGRGFGSLFALGKVLNFFPVGGERECQPSGYTVARAGICLNPYDCRQRDGKAAGDCAHGLGVCCVFEVTCGGTIQNNLTYFMSPGFPELWTEEKTCDVHIEKTHAGIMQLRIDFVHFTIGQPNRRTGECDEDIMILGEGPSNFTACGQNHGQHIYYTLSSASETREAGELPSTKSTRLSIRMRGTDMPRLWLLRFAQMPLAHSAPHNCLQYFTENNGTIKTFNYAVNGRHLARHEYRACVRRNVGFCSVRYAPCDSRSFRIEPSGDPNVPVDPPIDTMQMEELMPVNDVQNEEEGSGADPQMATQIENTTAAPGVLARIWSFMWPSWMWGQRRSWDQSRPWTRRSWSWNRWSPYAQHYNTPEDDKFRYYGYGNYGLGLHGFGRLRCRDRLTIPCENEYFVATSGWAPGVCDPHHCGNNFCPGVNFQQCKVESSITPFAVSVHFGPPTLKRNPEENIGACLRYTQVACNS